MKVIHLLIDKNVNEMLVYKYKMKRFIWRLNCHLIKI